MTDRPFPTAMSDVTVKSISQPSVSEIYVWLIPIGAALVHFLEFDIAGYSSTGWLWILYLFAALGLYQVEVTLNRSCLIAFPMRPWIIWYGYIWLSLAWCPGIGGRNIQDAMMITMPLVVAVLASMVFRHPQQMKNLIGAFLVAVGLLLFRFVCTQIGLADPESQPGARIIAITACFLACVCLAQSSVRPGLAYAGWTACLFMTAGSVSRMATAIILVLPVLNPNNKNRWARGAMVAAMPFCALAVFYSSAFQERFFYSGSGTLTDVMNGNFLSYGRLEAWPAIFEEASSRPWLGAGVGTVVDFVPTVWPEEDKPHNEYLRVFFEGGLVGVILFVAAMIWQIRDLHRRIRSTDGVTKTAFTACVLGWYAFLIFSLSDNVLIYNLFYNNLLFALMGAAYGLHLGQDKHDVGKVQSDAEKIT